MAFQQLELVGVIDPLNQQSDFPWFNGFIPIDFNIEIEINNDTTFSSILENVDL